MATQDSLEANVLKFEWIVRNVGELFEASKGETKSRVTKSPKFGGGRWQIMFYANSGTVSTEGYAYVSLYLSCEPTQEERENSVNGADKWVRDGIYKFSFELRNQQKTMLFQTKEASNHSFSYKTVNWGWAQYARRDQIYYNASSVRNSDALLIVCNISTIPAPPKPPSPTPYRRVPRDLLFSIGNLLDDPTYSDVEFVLPRRHRNGRRKKAQPRIIYASRKILQRVDYFDTMFHSGFAEGSSVLTMPTRDESSIMTLTDADMTDVETEEDSGLADRKISKYEDSDDEDDSCDWEGEESEPEEESIQSNSSSTQRMSLQITTSTTEDPDDAAKDPPIPPPVRLPSPIAEEHGTSDRSFEGNNSSEEAEEVDRNVRPKLSHPSSPRRAETKLPSPLRWGVPQTPHVVATEKTEKPIPGPSKVRVVMKDAPYSTYRAVLYYIYTDTIVFAPLASSFTSYSTALAALRSPGPQTPAATMTEKSDTAFPSKTLPLPPNEPHSRRAWIKEWQEENPGRPKPCSAKAVYRLADRLDLPELKERAFQHIVKSLTVENVAYEVFSDFSAAFEDVRKVEVEYFLENWSKIRSSDTMRNVWQQIRVGRHPGFEEVWPLIAENLEFKPKEPHPE